MISPSQRPLPDNTQHSQQTNIHAPGGIRTHDRSRRAAVDLRLRPLDYWDRQDKLYKVLKFQRWNLSAKTNGCSCFVRCFSVQCTGDSLILPSQQHTIEVRRNVTGLTIIKFLVESYLHADHHLMCYGLLSFKFIQLLELIGEWEKLLLTDHCPRTVITTYRTCRQ